eukprot:4894145-Pyramimonas_sp.AAC.1
MFGRRIELASRRVASHGLSGQLSERVHFFSVGCNVHGGVPAQVGRGVLKAPRPLPGAGAAAGGGSRGVKEATGQHKNEQEFERDDVVMSYRKCLNWAWSKSNVLPLTGRSSGPPYGGPKLGLCDTKS